MSRTQLWMNLMESNACKSRTTKMLKLLKPWRKPNKSKKKKSPRVAHLLKANLKTQARVKIKETSPVVYIKERFISLSTQNQLRSRTTFATYNSLKMKDSYTALTPCLLQASRL
jgi:hypothetical protein